MDENDDLDSDDQDSVGDGSANPEAGTTNQTTSRETVNEMKDDAYADTANGQKNKGDCNSQGQDNDNKHYRRKKRLMAIDDQEQFCIHHMDFCKCPMENYTIVYRFSTKELTELRDRFETIC